MTERVLVLERVRGGKVAAGHALPENRARALARAFFSAYLHQVCVEVIYHADPHRGNVLLTDDGRLALLDFGLLGRLDTDTRTTLSLLLLALAHNRAEDVADLILELSLTTVDTDEAGFLHEVRRKLPRYHWRPLAGIHTGEALADLQRLALRYGIRLPASFALVGKTLAQADSIARTLDPSLDPVELLRGDAVTLLVGEAEKRLAPNELLGTTLTQLQPLVRLPRQTGRLFERLGRGSLKIGVVPTGAAMIVVGLLIASALMARVNHEVALAGPSLSAAIGRTWSRASSGLRESSEA